MNPPTDVYFFATCLVDLFLPAAGLDAVTLIEQEGVRVHVPTGQSCCGQPAYSSGQRHEAITVARGQLALFPQPWPIVVPSGSCGGMMRHHWPKLFEGAPDEARAREVAARIVELHDFLLHTLDITHSPRWPQAQPTPPDVAPLRVAVHTSCGARREMGTHQHGWALVDALPGVQRVVHAHESECCGFGGTFSIRHPDISGAMVADKADALQGTGAATFVTADGGCLLNINGKLGKTEGACGAPGGSGEPGGCGAFQGQHLASFLLQRMQAAGRCGGDCQSPSSATAAPSPQKGHA